VLYRKDRSHLLGFKAVVGHDPGDFVLGAPEATRDVPALLGHDAIATSES
jgi:hypothetical protein